MSFYTGTQSELLYTMGAAVTKNTYTTQAVISATSTAARATVPAGYFSSVPNGIGRALGLQVRGTIANTAAATFQMVLGWDTTAGTLGGNLSTVWPTLAPTAATTCLWELDALITAQAVGAAGLSLQTNGRLTMSVVGGGVLSTAPQVVQFQTLTTGLNSEVQSFVELFGTWSASSASNTTTINQFLLYGLN